MKKPIFCVLWVILLISWVGSVTTFAADEIVLGIPTSIYTPFGKENIKAVQLAVEEINSKGGVKVGDKAYKLKVQIADTRGGEPTTPVHDALMAYEKLITEHKPHAIVVGAFRSEVLIAAMDIVAKYKIPHLGTIAQTPKFQAQFQTDPQKYKYLFRVTTDAAIDAMYANAMLDKLKKDFNLKKAYFIYQDTLWAKAFAGLMSKHVKETGWEELGFDGYAAGATDFSPALQKIKEQKAQVIGMVWDVPLGAGIFTKQYASMKVPALLFAGLVPPIGAPQAPKTIGPAVEYSLNLEFPVGSSLPLKKLPKTVEFLENFKKKFGDLPEAPAVNSSAYDSVYILKEAIEKANSLNADDIVAALEKTDYKGVSGRIRFDKNHTAIFGLENPNETGVCVVFQWQKDEKGNLVRVPVFPEFLAEGKVILPPWMK